MSLFTPKVRIYEVRNRGRLYDFGFYIGIVSLYGGALRDSYHVIQEPYPGAGRF